MSLPTHAEHNQSPEPDPLLAFLAEPDAVSPLVPPPAPAPAPEPVVKAEVPPPAAAVARDSEEVAELRRRVERTERTLDKSVREVSTLKADLATLVGVVDDIKKRQSRRIAPSPPPLALPARARRSGAAAAAAAILVTLVAWAMLSMASYDMPDPGPVENDVVEPAATAPPAGAVAVPATVELKQAAVVSTVADPPVEAVRSAPPARAEPRRVAAYVGTLTIDSSPAGEVFVNRKSVGRTPVRVAGLRAGSHLIWIQREGYRRWTRVVPVAADRISRVTADLDPLSR